MRELSELQEYLSHRLETIREHLPHRADDGGETPEHTPSIDS